MRLKSTFKVACHFQIVQQIIGKVEDKIPKTNVGLTPLLIVTREDKNSRKDNGTTPLQNAAYQGHLQFCQDNIKNMKDKNPKDNNNLFECFDKLLLQRFSNFTISNDFSEQILQNFD